MHDLIANLLQNGTNADLTLQVNWGSFLFALLTALICGIVIYLIYRFFYRGIVYNDNFNLLLVLVTIITAFIITTVSSNLALSLGMVGALSIVRFRTAIKDPLDVGFIFWAIAAGLTAGAGLYLIALLGTIFVALIYLGMGLLKFKNQNFLLVIKYPQTADEVIKKTLKNYHYSLKNKSSYHNHVELTIEIKQDNDLDLVLRQLKEVESVVKVEYNGDYLG